MAKAKSRKTAAKKGMDPAVKRKVKRKATVAKRKASRAKGKVKQDLSRAKARRRSAAMWWRKEAS